MEPLIEVSSSVQTETLTEGEGQAKKLFITGIFAQADIQNKNGRIYPRPVMEREIGRYVREAVNEGMGYGELGHPNTPSVNLDKACMIIKELHMRGNDVYGKAQIIDEGNGKIIKAIIEAGGKFGVSTRGFGSVVSNRNGAKIVQEDFKLTAVDVVANPSAPNAFVAGLMEQREWIWENGIIKEAELDDMRKQVLSAPSKQLKQTFFNVFEEFMSKLSNK